VSEAILVVNAGSSSIKFQLFALDARDQLQRLLKGQIEGIGVHPRLVASGTDGPPIEESWPEPEVASVPQALEKLVGFLRARLGRLPTAIGHRVVHGGPDYSEPTVIDDTVLTRLHTFSPLAPLHQPNNLAPIRAVRVQQPQLLQVACFDTAFHRGHPEVADRYALPEVLYAEGVRRYGFHGLSYELPRASGRTRRPSARRWPNA
jgi:acetate kinase